MQDAYIIKQMIGEGFRRGRSGVCGLLVSVLLVGCASTETGSAVDAAAGPSGSAADRVAALQVVDCLLPGMVRVLGNSEYFAPRRPVKTTAADCSIRGGEYTAYDRADYKTSLNVWMPAAKSGDAEAQTNVGEIYERGLGGDPNYEAALIWYRRAAEQGDTRAQFNLGTLYEQGLGVEKDKLAALNWYRQAWGIPEDSVVYQSAASQESAELRRQLNEAIEQRDSRIRKLEKDVRELEATAGQGESDQASAEQEIRELNQWIATLQSERSDSAEQLASLPIAAAPTAAMPKLREPTVAAGNVSVRDAGGSISRDGINFGRYFALVIGNQQYANLEDLDTPKNDALRMAKLLREKYGFTVEVLLDADNVSVMEKINDLNNELGEDDNLLIYYAGHGARTRTGEFENGYWLPINADAPPRNTYWVSNEFVTGHISRIKARRVLVVADSCYAGLLSDAPSYLMLKGGPEYTEEFLRYKLPKRSRLLLSSGGDKPVLDNGSPGHSVFAAVLLETLENNNSVLSGPQLFSAIDGEVRERSRQSGFSQAAEYKVIKGAGHEVGDFFFVPI